MFCQSARLRKIEVHHSNVRVCFDIDRKITCVTRKLSSGKNIPSEVAVVTDHFRGAWRWHISADPFSLFEQRQSQHARSRAGNLPQSRRFVPHSGCLQLSQKLQRLARPFAAHILEEHCQALGQTCLPQSTATTYFSSARLGQSCPPTIAHDFCGHLSMWQPRAAHRGPGASLSAIVQGVTRETGKWRATKRPCDLHGPEMCLQYSYMIVQFDTETTLKCVLSQPPQPLPLLPLVPPSPSSSSSVSPPSLLRRSCCSSSPHGNGNVNLHAKATRETCAVGCQERSLHPLPSSSLLIPSSPTLISAWRRRRGEGGRGKLRQEGLRQRMRRSWKELHNEGENAHRFVTFCTQGVLAPNFVQFVTKFVLADRRAGGIRPTALNMEFDGAGQSYGRPWSFVAGCSCFLDLMNAIFQTAKSHIGDRRSQW